MEIEWSEASTKRGIIWVATALVGSVFVFLGKPVDQLLLLAGGVAGGLGVILKDQAMPKVVGFVVVMVSISLSVIVFAIVIVLMDGLYDEKVNNSDIFELISPAFQTIIGGMIGILSGIKLGSEQ